MMNQQRQDVILADCIERLQAGESVADCLARYGDQATALVPLLTVAERLQGVGTFQLTAEQRTQAKTTLRAALRRQPRPSVRAEGPTPWYARLAPLRSMRSPALAGVLAAMLVLTVSVAVIAASQPGDAAYAARIVAERAPVLLNTTADARIATELRVADRRLADAEQFLAATGRIERRAVAALLSGDQAAAERATRASETERAAVAARVETHAATLAQMAEGAPSHQARMALQQAAAQAFAIATRLQPVGPAPGPGPSASPWPSATPVSTAQPGGVGPAPHATPPRGNPTATPGANSPTATPGANSPTATPPRGNPTATPGANNPTATPGANNPTATPGANNPTATPGANSPTATPGANSPTATPGAGNPTATPGAGHPMPTPRH